MLPTNGHEEVFGVDGRWNTRRGIRNNNCYSYAMGDYRPHRRNKAVVGDLAGYAHDVRYDSCNPLKKRLLEDNPGRVYPVRPEVPCRAGFYKIMMFVASARRERGYGDFHFYKQHKDVAYEVQPGDTIDSIGSFFGVSRDIVMRAARGNSRLTPGTQLRLENVNVFSHKLGWATPALLKDSCNRAIKDPRKACRKYSVTYDKYCGAYCVRARRVKTSR